VHASSVFKGNQTHALRVPSKRNGTRSASTTLPPGLCGLVVAAIFTIVTTFLPVFHAGTTIVIVAGLLVVIRSILSAIFAIFFAVLLAIIAVFRSFVAALATVFDTVAIAFTSHVRGFTTFVIAALAVTASDDSNTVAIASRPAVAKAGLPVASNFGKFPS
jgi:hypothetical protein